MLSRSMKRFGILALAVMLVPCAAGVALAETLRIDYGTVEAIEIQRGHETKPINPGSVIGGVAGGVIGHQVGGGGGKTAATVLGAVGGAVVGNEIEKKRQQDHYRITVRLESGSTLIVDKTNDPQLRVGDRVRVENDHVYRL